MGRKYGIGKWGAGTYDLGAPENEWLPVPITEPVGPWVPATISSNFWMPVTISLDLWVCGFLFLDWCYNLWC